MKKPHDDEHESENSPHDIDHEGERGHTLEPSLDDLDFDELSDEESLKKLRSRLKICLAERQEYLDGWQRMRADFVNARREEERRRAQYVTFAEESLIADLVPVLDSFDLAIGNREAWETAPQTWRVGVESIHAQLLSILKAHGVETFNPTGELFDPAMHIAVESIQTEESAKNHTIARVLQRGYRLHQRIIRPASVTIFSDDT